ncbi:unnamed protein product [Caenorhabditis angaria]|uniref:F-box domain-containing protein n=1 Tax=Caenorhabditis angaria TaxID=860376 RepID=A0A9P1ITX5_9PELO|nr:unnamed protein product [Caenorhabditis angaria]
MDVPTEKETFSIIKSLPPELAIMVVDRMGPIERGKFSQCSKLCNDLVKDVKKKTTSLDFRDNRTYATIHVSSQNKKTFYKYYYTFEKVGEENFKICWKSDGKEDWRVKLADDVDLYKVGCQLFRSLIQKYQRSIESLTLCITRDQNFDFDFGFEKLTHLKYLTLSGNFDVGKIMTKLPNPLYYLFIFVDESISIDFDQVFNTRNRLRIPRHPINNEQLLKIRAKYLDVSIGSLSEENIADFVKSYQNDTMNHNALNYCWLINGQFDLRKLWRLLGSEEENYQKMLPIRHLTKRKCALLNFDNVILTWRNPMG